MIRVATFNARGPHAGNILILRPINGPQQWTVKVAVTRDGVRDEHTIRSSGRIDLSAMRDIVFDSFAELLPAGTLIDDARMDFFIGGKRR